MKYGKSTILCTGRANIQSTDPIAVRYGHLLMVCIFEKDTGVITHLEINSICNLTNNFISKIIVGKNLFTHQDLICNEINRSYSGTLKKALCTCVKDMVSKASARIKE